MGAPLDLRLLAEADRPAIERHLLALGDAGRRERFHQVCKDAAITAYVRRLDFGRMILFGAVARDGGAIVGMAEAHLDDPRAPGAAELAVSILRGWRNRGLARRLVDRAAAQAFTRGAQRAVLNFQPDNPGMAGLVASLATALGPRLRRAFGQATVLPAGEPQPVG